MSSFLPLRLPEYPGLFVVKRVTDAGVWSIYFNTVLLVTLDERDFLIRG